MFRSLHTAFIGAVALCLLLTVLSIGRPWIQLRDCQIVGLLIMGLVFFIFATSKPQRPGGRR